jgi:hypothetical protein
VKLVLDELESMGFFTPSEPPRVWWIGSGIASPFPFHAAGDYLKDIDAIGSPPTPATRVFQVDLLVFVGPMGSSVVVADRGVSNCANEDRGGGLGTYGGSGYA